MYKTLGQSAGILVNHDTPSVFSPTHHWWMLIRGGFFSRRQYGSCKNTKQGLAPNVSFMVTQTSIDQW
ncbi:hypothetical protein XENTR_v10015024 [Xenopus tropicalis]|nr:hypothetical protein XENTR_v10015024 [Xenopus tropicalis]